MRLIFVATALGMSAVGAQSQTMVMPIGATASVLRTGTPIVLKPLEKISTKEKAAHVNDRIRMEVAEAVTVDDVVVIPAGSPAIGELTSVQNEGMWGKSGRFSGRALTVNANGRTIRLSGTFESKGGSGTAGAVAASAIVFAPAGFVMTGKSATLEPGAIIRAFIDEDVPFAVAPGSAPASAPMVIKR